MITVPLRSLFVISADLRRRCHLNPESEMEVIQMW